jgi:hypothetical protein
MVATAIEAAIMAAPVGRTVEFAAVVRSVAVVEFAAVAVAGNAGKRLNPLQ